MIGWALWLLASSAVADSARPQETRSAEEIFQAAQKDMQAGFYSHAEEGFRKVLLLDPRSAAGYANLGVVYMRTDRFQDAAEAFRQAARLAPEVAGIHLNLGLAYLRLNQYKEAIEPFRRALELDPGQTRSRYLLGLSCYMADDFKAAIEALEPLYPEFSSKLDYLYIVGSSFGKTGNEKEAARVFDQMFKVGGDSPRIHWLMGNAFLRQQVNQKAVEELEKARADPLLPNVHYSLALAYYRVKRLDQAMKELNEEISINPGFPSSYGLLGSI